MRLGKGKQGDVNGKESEIASNRRFSHQCGERSRKQIKQHPHTCADQQIEAQETSPHRLPVFGLPDHLDRCPAKQAGNTPFYPEDKAGNKGICSVAFRTQASGQKNRYKKTHGERQSITHEVPDGSIQCMSGVSGNPLLHIRFILPYPGPGRCTFREVSAFLCAEISSIKAICLSALHFSRYEAYALRPRR